MAHTADMDCNTETVAISIQENVDMWDEAIIVRRTIKFDRFSRLAQSGGFSVRSFGLRMASFSCR